jgi:hypothetical protein
MPPRAVVAASHSLFNCEMPHSCSHALLTNSSDESLPRPSSSIKTPSIRAMFSMPLLHLSHPRNHRKEAEEEKGS